MIQPQTTFSALSLAQSRVYNVLTERSLFKLIGGGSLTKPSHVGALAWVYAMAGAQCIDIAPDIQVLNAVDEALNQLPSDIPQPMVMISLPLDPDPHFRKMNVEQSACIACDLCTPICPTDAITVMDTLQIDQPLCYGCGRCVPVCPTDALSMADVHPNQADVLEVLRHPRVEAVEIHSRYADAALISDFLARYEEGLTGKALAICFQPTAVAIDYWQPFVSQWIQVQQRLTPHFPLIIQVDGRPMSGLDEMGAHGKEGAQRALDAAHYLWRELTSEQRQSVMVMLSGGVNTYTAVGIHQDTETFIAGVGMGTVARQAVWESLLPLLAKSDFQVALPSGRYRRYDATQLGWQAVIQQAKAMTCGFINKNTKRIHGVSPWVRPVTPTSVRRSEVASVSVSRLACEVTA